MLSKLLHRFQRNFAQRDRDHQELAVGGPNRRPTNPRWRTDAILKKTVKSPYLSNRLIGFDEIWHAGGDWPHTWGRSLKFPIFQKTRCGGSHLEKSQISRYHSNVLTDLREIWHDCAKWVS